MNFFSWLYTRSVHTRNIMLFCVIFILVLSVFITWHQLRGQPQIHDEAIVAATQPLLRIGTTHAFLEGLVREIGSSFVATVQIVPYQESSDETKSPCDAMDIFFGISDVDGWVKDICGGDQRVALVFLDTYIQAQEKKNNQEVSTSSQSVYATGYFWLSAQGAKSTARAIAQVLSSADSVHKISYLDSSYTIGHQLDDVYKKVKDRLYDMRKVWLVGWGDGWGAIADEYGSSVQQTIDITYDPSAQPESLRKLNTDIRNHARSLVLTDATFPLQLFAEKYSSASRRVATLDPWGDFSDTWSFSAFVEQNLLRLAQVL